MAIAIAITCAITIAITIAMTIDIATYCVPRPDNAGPARVATGLFGVADVAGGAGVATVS